MPDFSAERSLTIFLLLNAAVFGSAFLFARRQMTRSRSQALLDSALLGYAIQYVAVGLPGLLGCLHPMQVYLTALILSAGLAIAAFSRRSLTRPEEIINSSLDPALRRTSETGVIAVALFVISFVVLFAHTRAYQPVISNDALTYHFPAAVQWLQRGKIGLFQTWFFNPANTYSPLAGSIFIAWLIVPFSSDVLARFVEVPALLCVGLGMYRLCRVIEISQKAGRVGPVRGRIACALIAASAVLARPVFEPCMMGKDDLFVAFFFAAAIVALSPGAANERWGSLRFGIAVGLLLATKYTALMCAPLLLLALDAPRWCVRRWVSAILAAILLAGPWYLRNWIETGNPLFPIVIPHLFHGLFTTSRSLAFGSLASERSVVIGGAYGLPTALAIIMGLGWISCWMLFRREVWLNPILRIFVIGSIAGIAIFFWRSPFPEIRFLLPVFLLVFACVASISGQGKKAVVITGFVSGASLFTVLDHTLWSTTAWLTGISLLLAFAGVSARWWAGSRRIRSISITAAGLSVFCVFAFINWNAYSSGGVEDAFYSAEYPGLARLWKSVEQNVPADATVAYTNVYMVYPMQGRALQRRLIYVPTRSDVSSIADLGWLGSNLSGEQLIPAAVRATVDSPNRSVWLANLRKSGAGYLVIGRGGAAGVPPEARFVAKDKEFELLFEESAGWIYRIK